MIQIDLSTEDLHSTRFAYSPLIELSSSYEMLKNPDAQRIFPRWMDAATRSLNGLEFPYLDALIHDCSYIPDFLTPTPTRTDLTFEDDLQKLLHTPTSIIQECIQHLIDKEGNTEVRQQYLIYPREMVQ